MAKLPASFQNDFPTFTGGEEEEEEEEVEEEA